MSLRKLVMPGTMLVSSTMLLLEFARQSATIKSAAPLTSTLNVLDSLADIATSLLDLVTAIGTTTVLFGEQFPACFGTLICAVVPLALLGLWTLGRLEALLGALRRRKEITSDFRESGSFN